MAAVRTGALVLLATVAADAALARSPLPDTPTAAVSLAQLPSEGRETYSRILAGGPFRYDKDGLVFGNRERILPARTRGHYREYTVETPRARSRGARRIVCGGAPRTPDRCYYTDDHYTSFREIAP
ncbi:MAG: ribonuclease [Hyphomicrobiales bacterium]|nr:MAG: ribonuclease [Hyphomicrobiales bacterium]